MQEALALGFGPRAGRLDLGREMKGRGSPAEGGLVGNGRVELQPHLPKHGPRLGTHLVQGADLPGF